MSNSSAIKVVANNPSGAANQVLATPNGASGQSALRSLVDGDVPATLTGTGSLKNKTLTGASMGNAVSLLTKTDNSTAITGNGSAQNVFSYTLPANTMAAGKGIRITAYVQQG